MKTTHILALLACLFLAACGGGGSDGKEQTLLVIGNSITHHAPIPSIGWSGDWGMAASAREKDFPHLAGASLNANVTATNFAESGIDIERRPEAATDQAVATMAAGVDDRTLVVIELGDNVPEGGATAFAERLARLLGAVKGAQKVICLSTWWGGTTGTDAAIVATCGAAGVQVVYLGDLFPVRLDDVGKFSDRDVDRHPHDWGMAQIAARVVAALRTPE